MQWWAADCARCKGAEHHVMIWQVERAQKGEGGGGEGMGARDRGRDGIDLWSGERPPLLVEDRLGTDAKLQV
jgi:hypothetical protein